MRKACQSDYATARQILVANPGLSPLRVGKALGSDFPTPKAIASNIARQCPACAWRLFHSDLFRLEWVTACPLHGEPLVALCPKCERPWPDIHSLKFNDCEVCGLPNVAELPGRMIPDSEMGAFERLSAFRHSPAPGLELGKVWEWADQLDALYWQNRQVKCCFCPVTPESPYFPAFQAFWHPEFTPCELKTLGVEMAEVPIREFSAPVMPWRAPEISERTWWRHNGKIEGLIRSPLPKRIAIIGRVAREITLWIRRNAPHNHALRVGHFTGTLESYVERGAVPCPFCLAFSMWWSVVTQRYCNPKGALRSAHLMFTANLRYRPWPALLERVVLEAREPSDLRGQTQFFRPALWFQQWFFERSLKLIFREMFDLSSFLVNRFVACQSEQNPTAWDPKNHFHGATSSSAMLALAMVKDRILVWSPQEDPLENLVPTTPEQLPTIDQDGLYIDSPLWGLKWTVDRKELWGPEMFVKTFEQVAITLQEFGWDRGWYRSSWYRLQL